MWIVVVTLIVVYQTEIGYVPTGETQDVWHLPNDRILKSERDCMAYIALNWPAWKARRVHAARCELLSGEEV